MDPGSKKQNIEGLYHNIAALVPVYTESGGNDTVIITTDGESLGDQRSLRWILRRLCRHLAVDLEAVREKYGRYIGRKNFIPLPLSPQLVLVPLYLREARVKGDRTGGYVNLLAVKRVEEKANDTPKSIIQLEGGLQLPCYYAAKTVNERLRMGEIVLNYAQQTNGANKYELPASPVHCTRVAEQPVNREQLTLLARELLTILLSSR